MATQSDMLLTNTNFHIALSTTLFLLLFNFNVITYWFDLKDEGRQNISITNKHQNTWYFMSLLLRVYAMTLVWMCVSFVLIVIFFIVIIKAISFDSSVFKRVIDGDREALVNMTNELTREKKDDDTITVRLLSDMMFGCFTKSPSNFKILLLFVISLAMTIIFSYTIAPYKYMQDSRLQKQNTQYYFAVLCVVMNALFILMLWQIQTM